MKKVWEIIRIRDLVFYIFFFVRNYLIESINIYIEDFV